MGDRERARGWQCGECGASGLVNPGQPLWLMNCDDCGLGPIEWANDCLSDGFVFHGLRDNDLDAPTKIKQADLRPL